MGWQTNGTVIRTNSRNTGPQVWDLDALAFQPIDSFGHDFHDQDLADSIADCLNLDGYNAMRADLDLGGNKIINVGQAQPGDPDYLSSVIIRDEYWNSMTFNSGDRVLTITAPNGDTMTANIPAGSGVDSSAIHVNVANEIGQIAEKAVPVSADLIVIEDSAASNVKKRVQIGNLPGTGGGGTNITGFTWTPSTADLEIEVDGGGAGDFNATIQQFQVMKLFGSIRRDCPNFVAGASYTIDLDEFQRSDVVNQGATTINIVAPTDATDPVIGGKFQVEGTVLVVNTSPGPITLQLNGGAVPATDILGAPNDTDAGAKSMLTVQVFNTGGSLNAIFIWSAVTP